MNIYTIFFIACAIAIAYISIGVVITIITLICQGKGGIKRFWLQKWTLNIASDVIQKAAFFIFSIVMWPVVVSIAWAKSKEANEAVAKF